MRLNLASSLLVFGAILIGTGSAILLWTLGTPWEWRSLWPAPFMLIGVALILYGVLGGGPEGAVFAGVFLALGGLALFLSKTTLTSSELARIWPLFMGVCAVSLLVHGLRKPHGSRASYTVPSLVTLFLAVVFSVFSFNLIERDFLRFAVVWWPVVLVLGGAVLLTLTVLGRSE